MTDGLTALGAASSFYIKNNGKDNTSYSNSWNYANRGTLVLGYGCLLWDHTMETETEYENNEKITFDENTGEANEKNKGSWNQGNLLVGYCGVVNLRNFNSGVAIIGSRGVIRTPYNDGVIIAGNINEQPEKLGRETHTEFYAKYKDWHTHVAGPGVFIRGCLRVRDENALDGIKQTPSLIQLSDITSLATELKGNLKLTENCNIYDKNGKQIVKGGALVK